MQMTYVGPFSIINHSEKVFRVNFHNRQVSISINRLKPVYILGVKPDDEWRAAPTDDIRPQKQQQLALQDNE